MSTGEKSLPEFKSGKADMERTMDGQRYITRGSREFYLVSACFFAAGLATFAVLYCVQPIFPELADEFHVSPAGSSLLLSLTTVFLAVSLPIAGALSDIIGRKVIMGWSLILSSVLCALSAFCPGFESLLFVRSIQGIVLAGLPAVAMAYLSEEVETKSLGFAMGLYISGNSVGGLFGRVLVSTVTDFSSWRMGIGLLAALSIFASLFFWRKLPPSRHFRAQQVTIRGILPSFGRQFRDPGLVCLFTVGALLMSGFVTLYNYIGFRLLAPPYLLSQSVVGSIFVVYLVGTFSSSWMGRIADRFGRRKVLLQNVLIMCVGALVTLAHSLAMIVLGVAIFTFGFFAGHSIASSWVGKRAISGRGQASSLYLLFYYIGSSVSGSAGGIFWVDFHWTGIVTMITVLLAAAAVVSIVLSFIPNVQQVGTERSLIENQTILDGDT